MMNFFNTTGCMETRQIVCPFLTCPCPDQSNYMLQLYIVNY